jgi:hypothetical protein
MIRQVPTYKKRKLAACMRRSAFVKGFNDRRKGKPLDYEAFPYDVNSQWDYERGRLFACVFNGALKQGNKLTWEAQSAMGEALREHVVF